MDGYLVLAALIQVRVHARGRVEAHRARGQEVGHVVGLELDGLRALFAIGPLHRHRRRKAVTLEVNAVIVNTQRVVDLELVVLPRLRVGENIITGGIRHVGGEHLRLAIRQVIRGEVVGEEAEGVEPGAVEKRARTEGVIHRCRRITELRGLRLFLGLTE